MITLLILLIIGVIWSYVGIYMWANINYNIFFPSKINKRYIYVLLMLGPFCWVILIICLIFPLDMIDRIKKYLNKE